MVLSDMRSLSTVSGASRVALPRGGRGVANCSDDHGSAAWATARVRGPRDGLDLRGALRLALVARTARPGRRRSGEAVLNTRWETVRVQG